MTHVLFSDRSRPVEALQGWIGAAGISSGPHFRVVTTKSKLGEESITGHTVALVVKRYAGNAGLQVDDFSGHSLRAGFAPRLPIAAPTSTGSWTSAGTSIRGQSARISGVLIATRITLVAGFSEEQIAATNSC